MLLNPRYPLSSCFLQLRGQLLPLLSLHPQLPLPHCQSALHLLLLRRDKCSLLVEAVDDGFQLFGLLQLLLVGDDLVLVALCLDGE